MVRVEIEITCMESHSFCFISEPMSFFLLSIGVVSKFLYINLFVRRSHHFYFSLVLTVFISPPFIKFLDTFYPMKTENSTRMDNLKTLHFFYFFNNIITIILKEQTFTLLIHSCMISLHRYFVYPNTPKI